MHKLLRLGIDDLRYTKVTETALVKSHRVEVLLIYKRKIHGRS